MKRKYFFTNLIFFSIFLVFFNEAWADNQTLIRKDFAKRIAFSLEIRIPQASILQKSPGGAVKKVVSEYSELSYQSEEIDYWKTVDETLADKGGDCEDLAIFTASRLIDLGFERSNIAFLVCKMVNSKHCHVQTIILFRNKWMVFSKYELEDFKYLLLDNAPYTFLSFHRLDNSEPVYREDLMSFIKNLPKK